MACAESVVFICSVYAGEERGDLEQAYRGWHEMADKR